MNKLVKVAIGIGAVVAAGLGVALCIKKPNNAEYVTVDDDVIEEIDSDSDEEEVE